jgi:glycosyltransferase 2 family protein
VRCTADNALSYVAGFLALPAPGGLGVREAILQQMLTDELQPAGGAAAWAALAAVFVRLLWTVTDVAMAAVVYWLPAK